VVALPVPLVDLRADGARGATQAGVGGILAAVGVHATAQLVPARLRGKAKGAASMANRDAMRYCHCGWLGRQGASWAGACLCMKARASSAVSAFTLAHNAMCQQLIMPCVNKIKGKILAAQECALTQHAQRHTSVQLLRQPWHLQRTCAHWGLGWGPGAGLMPWPLPRSHCQCHWLIFMHVAPEGQHSELSGASCLAGAFMPPHSWYQPTCTWQCVSG
jgi:hypothetical protein